MANTAYLTMNSDVEDYERDRAENKLLVKLREAEEAVKDGEGWLDLDGLKTLVGEQERTRRRISCNGVRSNADMLDKEFEYFAPII